LLTGFLWGCWFLLHPDNNGITMIMIRIRSLPQFAFCAGTAFTP